MKKRMLYLCLLFSLAANAMAGGGKARFERISIAQGLSLSSVYCLAQDQRGFMWFGTEDGLNRFDGYQFKIFKPDPDNPRSLSDKWIESLLVGRDGKLWIISRVGLNRYDPLREQFTRFDHDPADPRTIFPGAIRVLCEDASGSLWVGGDAGLGRLDQRDAFVRFHHDPADNGSLSDNRVQTLLADRSGRLWVGTAAGLNCRIGDARSWRGFRHDPLDAASLSGDDVRALVQDDAGRIWIGSNAGLDCLDPLSGRIRRIPAPAGQGEVESLLFDGAGSLWVSTRAGVDRLDPQRQTWRRVVRDSQETRSLAANTRRPLHLDDKGMLWIGTFGAGVYRFDPGRDVLHHFRHDPADAVSISADSITAICSDRSGSVWLGTFGAGISKYSPKRYKFATLTRDSFDANSLSSDFVWSICEDRSGAVWIGTDARGLNRYDPASGAVTRYLPRPGDPAAMTQRPIRAVFEDSQGTLWLGTTDDGLVRFDRRSGRCTYFRHDPADPRSLSSNSVKAIHEDPSGVLWIGTHAGLNRFDRRRGTFTAYRHDPGNPRSLSHDLIYAGIVANPDGTMWIGTYGGGLNRFDPRSGLAERFVHDPGDGNSLSNDMVLAIHRDPAGAIWAGTRVGLNRFDPVSRRWQHWYESDGLANEVIYGIIPGHRSELWLSSNKGIICLQPATGTIRNYNMNDGLQSNEFNGGAWHAGRSGMAYFGGIYGLNLFRPGNIADNEYSPPVVITDFRIDNRSVQVGERRIAGYRLASSIPYADEIKLSYKETFFSFEFAALDYTAPAKNRYAYMLEGRDPGWIDQGDRHYVSFIRLSPGKYRLRVRGSNNDGRWNEMPGGLRIVIVGPFWSRWWFRALMAVLLVAGLLLFYRRRLKSMILKRELRAAHDAQMSIMPQGDPAPSGLDVSGICLPANEVGGDFFDYLWFQQDPNRFGIVIGDVSGKAMKAAMTAVMTSGMFLVKSHEAIPLPEMMSSINRSLCEKTDKTIFVAICLASFDLSRRHFRFCNSGLCRPLRLRRGAVTVLESAGDVPLGVLPDQQFPFQEVALQPGDVLVFFSDGVPEARNGEGEFFGNERLRTVFASAAALADSAVAVKKGIIAAIQAFSGSSRQFDDITLVVVRVP
jgi:ligand-binding sensor domain-containing protein/serine phosphatase RsbU (regulator of sigma subunit)